jgi:hypothetical protein
MDIPVPTHEVLGRRANLEGLAAENRRLDDFRQLSLAQISLPLFSLDF